MSVDNLSETRPIYRQQQGLEPFCVVWFYKCKFKKNPHFLPESDYDH